MYLLLVIIVEAFFRVLQVSEYYFDIELDEEIDPNVLCQYIREKSQGVFSDKLTQCEDIDSGGLEKFDIYSDDDSGEIC